MPFQTSVNVLLPVAVPGDFASANPRASYPAGPGGLVAGTGGVTVGYFAWVSTSDGITVTNAGSGAPQGFVANTLQASITTWLAEYSYIIPAGEPVTLMTAGDYWVKTGTTATVGQKIFASTTTGQIQTAAAGATVTGYVETPFYVASAGAANDLIKASTWSA